MFNLIMLLFSKVKILLSFDGGYVEAREECLASVNSLKDSMVDLCHHNCRLPLDYSVKIENIIQRNAKHAEYLQDKELDEAINKVSEVFQKIKYLDPD